MRVRFYRYDERPGANREHIYQSLTFRKEVGEWFEEIRHPIVKDCCKDEATVIDVEIDLILLIVNIFDLQWELIEE